MNYKIDIYLLCWNEERLLPWVLDYYSLFARNIYIFDNYSTDRTCEIAKSYSHVKQIIKYNTHNQFNDLMHMIIKNSVWKSSTADFCIIADCDELIYHPDWHSLCYYMIMHGETLCMPELFDVYKMYAPRYDNTAACILQHIEYGVPRFYMDRKIQFFDPHAIKDINFEPGAHIAFPEGDVKYHCKYNKSDIKCFHLKNFGKYEMIDRIISYRKRLSKVNIEQGWSHHYFKSVDDLSIDFDKNYVKSISLKDEIKIDEFYKNYKRMMKHAYK